MPGIKLAGGPTQDEIMAVSLFKLGLRNTDTVLEIGCGTGKVSIAAAQQAKKIFSLDKRPEAIAVARESAQKVPISNIEFFCTDAVEFLESERLFDCAFVGGTQQLGQDTSVACKKSEENNCDKRSTPQYSCPGGRNHETAGDIL